MLTDLIFYTQIASIVGFIAALFVVYRVLVSQKDSTIELLREKNQVLADQLEHLKSQSPEVLFESILKRYNVALEEIKGRDCGSRHWRKRGALPDSISRLSSSKLLG